jgi:guanine deaminase
LLADLCLRHGQRAFVGRVAMDHPETCPEAYRDPSAEAALAGTRRVIEHIRAAPGNAGGRVRPMVAPRFIPSCSDTLLAGLGDLARKADVAVTTHVSESDWEHGFVRDRHGRSDAESLDRFGLLRPGSVLAHGCFLSDGDMGLMRDRGAGVAHCPWSNAYFANAVFPLRRALDIGLPVGLGSDISGGPVGSVWETARMALVAARMRASGTDPDVPPDARSRHSGDRIDAVTAFWLATAAGADALGLDVGRFRPGQRLDALLLVPRDDTSAIARWPGEDEAPARRLERLLHGTGRADIAEVFVDGRRVAGAGTG